MISITYFLSPIQSVALGVVAHLSSLYLNRALGLDWVESTWTVLAIFAWSMFVADGFVVMSLRVGARIFRFDQTGMAAG